MLLKSSSGPSLPSSSTLLFQIHNGIMFGQIPGMDDVIDDLNNEATDPGAPYRHFLFTNIAFALHLDGTILETEAEITYTAKSYRMRGKIEFRNPFNLTHPNPEIEHGLLLRANWVNESNQYSEKTWALSLGAGYYLRF